MKYTSVQTHIHTYNDGESHRQIEIITLLIIKELIILATGAY